tara:strand:- start:2680 stop:3186 length:507 start_codon:yes stop_codon:yes gene_type:complete
MSGRFLDFKSYLGGANNVLFFEAFPRTQKTYTYNFGDDVSGYTFSADYQSVLLNTVAYNNITGEPNLTETTVSGYFTNTANISNSLITTTDAATGIVQLTIPQNRYTGNILPSTRANVVCTIVSFQWVTTDSPVQQDMHRYCILERFDPQVGKVPGDPADETTFVSLT